MSNEGPHHRPRAATPALSGFRARLLAALPTPVVVGAVLGAFIGAGASIVTAAMSDGRPVVIVQPVLVVTDGGDASPLARWQVPAQG